MFTKADLISVALGAFAFGAQLVNLLWFFIVTRKK